MAQEQRYRVVERLEAGGMAEVFKGESLSVQGFKKQVAIKRVLPHLAQNKNFIAMFLDEARLGARLNHANVVTVFDIGAADNTFFLVMEFVDGCNLKTVIETYRQQGRRIGVKDSIFICMEACKGLAYAHELTDDDGNILHIVHRDISPPNLLMSKRGEVKVTDFGLAKATTQLEKTDPGVVKGKFSYLSPEAALGQRVDPRTDVFALGIVLWELLAGRRLFLGETDYQTVKLVQQANIPSLARLNPEVDSELEGVIAKALAKDPEVRFQSAREFGDALAHYLFSHQLKVTSYDIANLVKFVVETRAAAKAGGPREQSIIDRLIQEELLRFTSLDDMSDPKVPSDPGADRDEGARPLDAGAFENPASWFSEDEDVMGAVGKVQQRSSGTGSDPGWRESGVEAADLASQLEDSQKIQLQAEEPPRLQRPQPQAQPIAAQQPVSQRPAREPTPQRVPTEEPKAPPKIAMPSEQPDRPGTSSSAALYLVIAIVVLAGGAAAAWFGGFIPH